MAEQNQNDPNFSPKDEENYKKNGLRQYGVLSAVVFQMLATMGLAFWGGKKLNDHFEISNNLLTVGIGFLGMGLAFYNLLNQLKNIQKNENKK